MRERTIAKRYAKGLIALAVDAGAVENVREELGRLSVALERVPNLLRALKDERVALDRRRALAGAVGQTLKLSAIVQPVVFLLLARRRIAILPQVVEEGLARTSALARITDVRARAADAASAADLAREIERLLGQRLAGTIRCAAAVDPSLIGGFILEIDDRRYDASVVGRLARLKERLLAAGAVSDED
jgi:F-type H+-transporting ATPase subunit delta